MPEPRCLITGCRLVDEGNGRSVWGDLHSCGTALVFNAVLTDGEAAWEYDTNGEAELESAHEKRVGLPPSFPFFERRGVIVFDKYNARLNQLAQRYLMGASS